MKTALSLLCTLGFGWCVWSCNKIESHSPIPEIHFKKLLVEDRRDSLGVTRTAVLTFSFIDGDGDLGEIDPNTKNPISRIHYTWYQKKRDRTYELYYFPGDSTTDQTFMIPYNSVMNKDEAQNKTLKGSIEMAVGTPLPSTGMDTMRIEYYITDRAQNSSNIEQTPDFSIQDITIVPITIDD